MAECPSGHICPSPLIHILWTVFIIIIYSSGSQILICNLPSPPSLSMGIVCVYIVQEGPNYFVECIVNQIQTFWKVKI